MKTDELAKELAAAAGLDPAGERFLMYLAGVPARRMAELAGVHPNAVHGVLRPYIVAVPGLKELHQSRVPGPRPEHDVPRQWLERLEGVLAHLSEHGELPYDNHKTSEGAALGRWLTTQRRHLRRGALSPQQIELLDHLRGWRATRRWSQTRDRNDLRVTQLAAFRLEHGRWPSHKAADPEERLIGVWLHGRRQAAANGALAVDLHERLDAETPGWRGRQFPARKQL
ncbi:helicase associated domain-containing protein [Arthrobacter cavernae]|uniref:Helicase associated domain-containing protein n=1 Tax=Arthrobacter cavernae TaxID=2817681 RepID=A0A939HKH1_9MICC|nr:helicase associated domain-containing protein [Arthrobacter cavernae]MBO1269823.1 helicase associated domain-containing protein [Arthrobacter cavernae]